MRRADVVAGIVGAIAAAGLSAAAGAEIQVGVAGAIAGLAFALSRSRPTAAWAVAAAALFVMVAWEDPDAFWLLLVGHAFAVGRWAPTRSSIAGALTLLAVTITAIAAGAEPVPLLITIAPAWVVGRGIREHQLVNERLAERVSELEAERETYAQLSVRYERARIAAELHDIVAHAISVMVVQAAAGQRLAGVDPRLTAETFEAIGGAARQAEDDLERLVALLADEEPMGGAPDLHLVEDLVARAAKTGLDVSLELAGEREGFPASTIQTAFRVVQESLTNALRYAAGAGVRVVVRGDVSDLLVEVHNGAATRAPTLDGHGTGNGLRGLRERLSACGGTLDAGPTAEGGWVVRARLPRRAAAPVA